MLHVLYSDIINDLCVSSVIYFWKTSLLLFVLGPATSEME